MNDEDKNILLDIIKSKYDIVYYTHNILSMEKCLGIQCDYPFKIISKILFDITVYYLEQNIEKDICLTKIKFFFEELNNIEVEKLCFQQIVYWPNIKINNNDIQKLGLLK